MVESRVADWKIGPPRPPAQYFPVAAKPARKPCTTVKGSSYSAVGDFNQDGKADLATANNGSNNVTIQLSNGSGGFTQPAGSPFGVGTNPRSVVIWDFNQDGKPDLATANSGSGNVTVQLNTCIPNTPPTITATPLSRNAGSPSANSQIATVNDLEDTEDILTITINDNASTTVNGVSVSGISVNAAGIVTADVVAACDATTANFTLRVTDSGDLFTEAMLTVTVNPDNQPPTITCPANLTKATDANLCSAVVSYAAPTVADNCPGLGAALCTPASGSAFPKGTTTVNCTVSDTSKNQASCSFTVTVNDTQPPTIACPPNQTAKTPAPGSTTVLVNYPAPTFSDNCAGASVACTPPSGSTFPVGTTTVTCTATDAAKNQSSCSFTVSAFDVCLQDDSTAATVLLFNSLTGDYRFCCRGTIFAGRGTVQKLGSTYTLTHNAADRRLSAKLEGALNRGTASLQSPVGTTRCTINDRDIRNNSCACAASGL
ncbi:MAG: HYR domain-containing protein [Acidobacteria bacterium]|nr:HYR domain-containing protein [Acidobacteriota bacterium]